MSRSSSWNCFESTRPDLARPSSPSFAGLESLRVYRPRTLIYGEPGSGQSYIGAAVLHHLEGFHVQSLDIGTLMGDSTRVSLLSSLLLFGSSSCLLFLLSVHRSRHRSTLRRSQATQALGSLHPFPLAVGTHDVRDGSFDRQGSSRQSRSFGSSHASRCRRWKPQRSPSRRQGLVRIFEGEQGRVEGFDPGEQILRVPLPLKFQN